MFDVVRRLFSLLPFIPEAVIMCHHGRRLACIVDKNRVRPCRRFRQAAALAPILIITPDGFINATVCL